MYSGQIINTLQCKEAHTPFVYLGAPIYKGRSKLAYFEPIYQKIKHKLEGWKCRYLSFAGKISLIRSVLCSIPVHTMSAIAVNSGTLRYIETIFRNFLWQQKDQHRCHWVSWDKICKPTECGGLGIRSLADTLFGLHGKLAWNIIQNKSLWSKWMNQKHCRGGQLTCTNLDSKLWRTLFPHVERIQEQAVWMIGKGHISFWTSNWSGAVIDPYNNPQLRVCDAIQDLDSISSCLTAEQLHSAKMIFLDVNQEDSLIYNPSPTGQFSVKSYIQDNMIKGSNPYWAKMIWHKTVPARLGAFMWKLMNRAVALDVRVRQKGINGPFKCNCCKAGSLETTNHLFLLSDFAKRIWQYFGKIFGITTMALSLPQLLHTWSKQLSLRSQLGYTAMGTVMYSLWGIWKERCRARFENVEMDTQRAINFITSNIQDLNQINHPKRQIDFWGKNILDRLSIPVKPLAVKRGVWLQWKKPSDGSYKLNTDGAIKNGVATIGGIIRNEMGDMVRAFWKKIELTTIDFVEMEAIIHGVHLCNSMGIDRCQTETDSMAVFKAATGSSRNPALTYMARKNGLNGRHIVHIHREQNVVADLLAKIARSEADDTPQIHSHLPGHIRAAFQLDKIGLQNYRKGNSSSRCVHV
ncbi:hypothetical protein CASFOL_042885 [Castilleja foliolosa]|uniref:Uncharacterized protein n=1 Tax=Castilleja foliolosa TaxID=1961234 RepID=A0ABD3B8M9_9LAMI